MKRLVTISVLALLAIVPLVAQSTDGWMVRADRSMSASDPDEAGEIQFMAMGSGFHAINPQAAVFWKPANTVSGTYTIKGNFTLMEPSSHNNYYGLVFGGSALEGADQAYLYFLVAQDGSWLIKRRVGNSDTESVADKTTSDLVKKPDASGKSVNALEVRVKESSIDYLVNGSVVHTTPKSGLTAMTDGLWGFRINHALNVMVDGLESS